MDSDGDTRNSSPEQREEKNPKRRMKTPFQLEALERVYAEDRYPTEAVRDELSHHLNLTDKQLQMWFCHRRLKDRKGKEDEVPSGRKKQKTDALGLTFDGSQTAAFMESEAGQHVFMRDPDDDEHFVEDDSGWMLGSAINHRRKTDEHEVTTFAGRKGNETIVSKVSKPRRVAEQLAVAAVEARLGEPLRDDGPHLGVEFDSLPPGAFASSAEGMEKSERRPTTLPPRPQNENRPEDRQESQPSKTGGLGLPPLPTSGLKRKSGVGLYGEQNVSSLHLPRASNQAIQFLPEQPITTEESSKSVQIHLNLHAHSDRPYELVPDSRVRSLSPLRSFLPANMHVTSGDGYGYQQERVDNFGISLMPPGESRAGGFYTNGLDLVDVYSRGLYGNFEVEGHAAFPQSTMQEFGTNRLSVGFESLALFQEQEQARVEKKRKTEEMKLAKESEAYAKRMRREHERQELLRQKKEEQMRRDLERQEVMRLRKEEQIRRELEKQDRDKKKEEERAERERQREEERIQREQKREIERQEKIAMKQNKKLEKQNRREELRKAKEAARLKAATERAAAKKLSKEWVETIEDEQLELLELNSSTSLDLYTSNGLERGDVELSKYSKVPFKKFPPALVRMKPALSFCSWNAPDHIAGHFFMVWRFLTTFADVIGLWSFTLDEFGRALHDFDTRLLGEIHVCLIKMLVQDIEDAAQAASGAGGSQNAINVVSGGHPQIVEAAYEWGFDIREWGQFVSPLTWPEILRQFALAAGYGPKWRCSNKSMSPSEEGEEQIEEENAVTVLRSGVAAANAFALMQGKGIGHLRRGRYRLTPGTVKYAAFHVLSLEGSKGLTILEVAEKIQKSGLRDLTSSKTPEASIAAALSRDANLFERVAPSTYCVRAAFRKEAEEAEEVLRSARERIDLFQSGFLDVEEAEKETDETEEMERDEEYDSDGQDVEDGVVRTPIRKNSEAQGESQEEVMGVNSAIDQEVEVDESQVGETWVQGLMEGEYSDLSIEERLMALVALVNVGNEGNTIRLALEARMEASSALKRQMWAEAQIERRRHKEEQLSRLQLTPAITAKNDSADPSVGPDGGPAQLIAVDDKQNELATGTKIETLELNSLPRESMTVPEGPAMSETILASHDKNLTMHEKDNCLQEVFTRESALAPSCLTDRSRAQVKLDIGISAEELYTVRSMPLGLDRRRNRYWQFVTCSGGQDPSHGRIYFESNEDDHWEVIDTEEALDALLISLDVRGTREAALHVVLVRLDGSLRREMRIAEARRSSSQDQSDTPESGIVSDIVHGVGSSRLLCHSGGDGNSCTGHELSSPANADFERSDIEEQTLFDRFKDFEKWIWSEKSSTLSSLKSSKFCRKKESDLLILCAKCHDLLWAADKNSHFCHEILGKTQIKHDLHSTDCQERTLKNEAAGKPCGSSTVVSPRLQMLKYNIILMEVIVPSEAWRDNWDQERRLAWASSVKCAVTPTELLQAFTELEKVMKHDWLSSLYDTWEESLSACKSYYNFSAVDSAPWMPHTSAAVSLRVMALDSALSFSAVQKRKQKQVEEVEVQHNTSISVSALLTAHDPATPDSSEMEDNGEVSGDVVISGRGRGRGKGVRGKRLNLKKKVVASNVKKRSKHKLQEEISVVPTKDLLQLKIGGRGQGRSRGRPRGHSTGRPRGRGIRVANRNQVSVGRIKKLRKEKNPNELSSKNAPPNRLLMEHSTEPAEADLQQEGEGEIEASRKSSWESEDAQDTDYDENNGINVEDGEDGDAEGQAEEGNEELKGYEVREDKQHVNASYTKKGGKVVDLDQNGESDSREEDQDLTEVSG